jgi:hypothetical protein
MEMRKYSRRGAAMIFIAVVFFSQFAQALSLEWDANVEPTIGGYRVYMGEASRSYTFASDVGNSTTAQLQNLPPGRTVYLAVTAYDTNGLESDFSDEITYTVPSFALQCSDCAEKLNHFLQSHPTSLPAPAGDCLESTLNSFATVVRAAKSLDEPGKAELIAVAECLNAVLNDRADLRQKRTTQLYASRWTGAATNLLQKLQTPVDYQNLGAVLKQFARYNAGLRRVDALLARGNAVPTAFTNGPVYFYLKKDSQPVRFTAAFGSSRVLLRMLDGSHLDDGTFSLTQTAWNEAELVMTLVSGNVIQLELQFGGRRGKVLGVGFTGSFLAP